MQWREQSKINSKSEGNEQLQKYYNNTNGLNNDNNNNNNNNDNAIYANSGKN